MTPLRIFIGYDPRQPVAFNTLAHSLWSNSTIPLSITRLQLNQLPITRTGLTEFTFSRFLVPHLCGYEGIAIFIDSDFLCRAEIGELMAFALAYPECDVFVSKNKLRFEWASLMVFNAARCKALTPEYIQNPAHACFDFAWAKTVGDLPPEWNHLVGYDAPRADAKMVHYTQGVPCWPETRESEHTEAWANTVQHLVSTVPFKDLMGNSVHAKHVYERLRTKKQSPVGA